MNARQLYEAGRLDEAIAAVGAELRASPTDARSRTFLFELLCFAGEYDRAEKQLDILADRGPDARMGVWMYRSALHAERTRQEMFREGTFPVLSGPPEPPSGTLNGESFDRIEDADPRVGSRLEIFAAGQYSLIPFAQLVSVTMEPPRMLRDLLWAPARVTAGPERQEELGEILLPAITAEAHRHEDDLVRLGRTAVVEADDEGGERPVGTKLLIVDGEPLPLLEVRELRITPA